MYPPPSPPRDEASFRAFYESRRAAMLGLVRLMVTGKAKDPEQIAIDAWTKFWPHWRDAEYPDAYVRRCIITACHGALAEACVEPPQQSLDTSIELAAPGDAIAVDLVASTDDDPWDPQLADALEQLSPKLREFVLLDIELNPGERSVAETARFLGVSRMAAYARRKRAYTQLLALLPADYPQARLIRRRRRRDAGGGSIA
jgi:DNA-directed RNA polymerase specialized sigma24 family protein